MSCYFDAMLRFAFLLIFLAACAPQATLTISSVPDLNTLSGQPFYLPDETSGAAVAADSALLSGASVTITGNGVSGSAQLLLEQALEVAQPGRSYRVIPLRLELPPAEPGFYLLLFEGRGDLLDQRAAVYLGQEQPTGLSYENAQVIVQLASGVRTFDIFAGELQAAE